ncbi:MAG: PorV/PorQ family protein [Fidelibacterota bacterium]|nr:MAG: PorV/PorQ family protein [Candidatus Neomarinimicrobiota bacterium]
MISRSEIARLMCGLLVVSLPLTAQVKRVGQSGMTFLDIDVGARPAATGGSFAATGGDVNSLFWNPAGIGAVRGLGFVGNQTAWLADMQMHSIGVAFGTDTYGVLGLSFLSMDNPDVRVTTFIGGERWEDQGFQDLIRQFALGIAYARQITNIFSVGGQVKWAHEDFGAFDYQDRRTGEQEADWEAKKDVIAFDFGTLYYTGFRDLRVALSVRNFSPRTRYQLEYFELPLTYRLGLALDVISVFRPETFRHSLTFSVDAISPRDFSERLQLGCEYWYREVLALRAGYKFNHDLESFATGFGIRQQLWKSTVLIDYAYSPIGGIFQDVHRFTLGIAH